MNKFEVSTMHYANPKRELYEVIKDIAKMMIEKSCPMKILYGVVKSVNPLLVHYTDKLVLDKDILIIPEYLEKGLCVGDALILIQKEGGQRFLAIGKESYQFSEYPNSENQYCNAVDNKVNPWYNENNSTVTGSLWAAKALLERDINGERKNYQPSFAVLSEDKGLIFSDYPHYIPYGNYYISNDVLDGISSGDKVFVSWKGSTPVVVNKIIDTEVVFEEDEEDNEYTVKIKSGEKEVIIEGCVKKENRVYVNLNEALRAYNEIDGESLTIEFKEPQFYSFGSAYRVMAIKKQIFGNEVKLDFVLPVNDSGSGSSISYNSLLGSRETVNIPFLWVNGEIYALIDGIYKAMKELLIYPSITGNMDKIPYYVSVLNGSDEGAEIIQTEDFYTYVDGEKKYYTEVLKTPDGVYVPFDRFIEIHSGSTETIGNDLYINDLKFEDSESENSTYKIILRDAENKNKIINVNNKAEVYKIKNYSSTDGIMVLSSDSTQTKFIALLEFGMDFSIRQQSYMELSKIYNYTKEAISQGHKPVMIKYIAAKKGYVVNQNKSKNCIELIKNGNVVKEIYQYAVYHGRSVVNSNLFAVSFVGWNERFHTLDDVFDTEEDAAIAMMLMHFSNDIFTDKTEEFEISKNKAGKYKIKKISTDVKVYPKLYKEGKANKDASYYITYGCFGSKGANGEYDIVPYAINTIMYECQHSYCVDYDISYEGDAQIRKAYIWNYILNNYCTLDGTKISKMHTAAIMGNIQQESNFSSLNLQGSNGRDDFDPEYINVYNAEDKKGWGLCQWTAKSRKQGLLDYAKKKNASVGNMNIQLEFLYYELTNTHKVNYKRFLEKTTLEDATEYFCKTIEGPGDPEMENRIKYAKEIYEEYK